MAKYLHLIKTGHLFARNLDVPVLSSVGQIRQKNRYREKRPKPFVQMDAMSKSLSQKGYLRAQNPYTPPDNVSGKIFDLQSDVSLSTGSGGSNFSSDDKFKFLTICAQEFGRAVPSSILHEINTIDAVIDFYETPVNTFLPLDELNSRTLPPNLHIQHEYVRFNPQTDTKFNGQTAFPKSSTIVTGLKYKNKYPGFIAKRSWP